MTVSHGAGKDMYFSYGNGAKNTGGPSNCELNVFFY